MLWRPFYSLELVELARDFLTSVVRGRAELCIICSLATKIRNALGSSAAPNAIQRIENVLMMFPTKQAGIKAIMNALASINSEGRYPTRWRFAISSHMRHSA